MKKKNRIMSKIDSAEKNIEFFGEK